MDERDERAVTAIESLLEIIEDYEAGRSVAYSLRGLSSEDIRAFLRQEKTPEQLGMRPLRFSDDG